MPVKAPKCEVRKYEFAFIMASNDAELRAQCVECGECHFLSLFFRSC